MGGELRMSGLFMGWCGVCPFCPTCCRRQVTSTTDTSISWSAAIRVANPYTECSLRLLRIWCSFFVEVGTLEP